MNAVVFGANGGIGDALVTALLARGTYGKVFAVSRQDYENGAAVPLNADPSDEQSLAELARTIGDYGPVSLCINAIGVLSKGSTLQPERSMKAQSAANFETVFKTNTIIPALITKHFVPLTARKERAVFAYLSARVGSISDNGLGGWHAYRASKAALNMLIRNYAIEQARTNPEFIAVGLHPGTVDTSLSKPFQKNVPDTKLFSPAQSAAYLIEVIEQLTPQDSGKVFDWAGKEIPA